jgi:hypothetical protein
MMFLDRKVNVDCTLARVTSVLIEHWQGRLLSSLYIDGDTFYFQLHCWALLCYDCTWTRRSFVLISHWRGLILFWFTLAGTSSVALCIGMSILCFYRTLGRRLFDTKFLAHAKESFVLRLRTRQPFAAGLFRSQRSLCPLGVGSEAYLPC